MKSISKIIPALMILVSSAAAQSLFTKQGTVELGGDISLSSQTTTYPEFNLYPYYPTNATSTQTSFSFDPYVGVMMGQGFELGMQPGFTLTNPGTATALHLYLAPAYNFDTQSNFYPYVEFLAGYVSEKDGISTSNGLGLGGDVGLKLAIKGSSLFLVKIEYINEAYTLKVPGSFLSNGNGYNYYAPSGTQYSIATLSFGVGFRVFFGHSATTNVPVEIKK